MEKTRSTIRRSSFFISYRQGEPVHYMCVAWNWSLNHNHCHRLFSSIVAIQLQLLLPYFMYECACVCGCTPVCACVECLCVCMCEWVFVCVCVHLFKYVWGSNSMVFFFLYHKAKSLVDYSSSECQKLNRKSVDSMAQICLCVQAIYTSLELNATRN